MWCMCRAESLSSFGAAEDASDPETAAELQRGDEPTCSLSKVLVPSKADASTASKRVQHNSGSSNQTDTMGLPPRTHKEPAILSARLGVTNGPPA
jgi:hypothetical protein